MNMKIAPSAVLSLWQPNYDCDSEVLVLSKSNIEHVRKKEAITSWLKGCAEHYNMIVTIHDNPSYLSITWI